MEYRIFATIFETLLALQRQLTLHEKFCHIPAAYLICSTPYECRRFKSNYFQ